MVSRIGTGERLRLVRGYRSKEDIASRLGIEPGLYEKFEREEDTPDLSLLIRLKHITKCSLDWLATGHDAGDLYWLDDGVLATIIRGVETETPKLNPETKAKLILRIYKDIRMQGNGTPPSRTAAD